MTPAGETPRPLATAEPDRQTGMRDDERPSRLELLTLIHVAGLVLFTAWDFGGETDLARLVISWWGSLALPIMVAACLRRLERRNGLPSALHWLWPLMFFDVLVFASTLNPSFTHAFVGGADALSASA